MAPRVRRSRGALTRDAKLFERAAVTGLNRAGRTERTMSARGVAKDGGLRVRDARQKIKFTRARRGTTRIKLEATGRPLNLTRFQAKQRKRGVSARPWGKRRIFKGAFILKKPGAPVLVRDKKTKKLRSAYGPGIANLFRDHAIGADQRAAFFRRYNVEFNRAIKVFREKAAASRARRRARRRAGP